MKTSQQWVDQLKAHGERVKPIELAILAEVTNTPMCLFANDKPGDLKLRPRAEVTTDYMNIAEKHLSDMSREDLLICMVLVLTSNHMIRHEQFVQLMKVTGALPPQDDQDKKA